MYATCVACAACCIFSSYVCTKKYPFKRMPHVCHVLHMYVKRHIHLKGCYIYGMCCICAPHVWRVLHIHVQRHIHLTQDATCVACAAYACSVCAMRHISTYKDVESEACAAYLCGRMLLVWHVLHIHVKNIQMCGVCCVKRCMHVKGGGWHVPCIDVQRIDPLKESRHEY